MLQTNDFADLFDQVKVSVLVFNVFFEDVQKGVHIFVLDKIRVFGKGCSEHSDNGSFFFDIGIVSFVLNELIPHVGINMGLNDDVIFFNRLGDDNFECFFQRKQVFFVVDDCLCEESGHLASDFVRFFGQMEVNKCVQDLVANLLLF